jgi:carbonic anhydrase
MPKTKSLSDPDVQEGAIEVKTAKEPAKKKLPTNYVICDVVKLEKKFTGKKDEAGNDEFNLIEDKVLKQVKILKEHLTVHSEQEPNTLKRYKEVK